MTQLQSKKNDELNVEIQHMLEVASTLFHSDDKKERFEAERAFNVSFSKYEELLDKLLGEERSKAFHQLLMRTGELEINVFTLLECYMLINHENIVGGGAEEFFKKYVPKMKEISAMFEENPNTARSMIQQCFDDDIAPAISRSRRLMQK